MGSGPSFSLIAQPSLFSIPGALAVFNHVQFLSSTCSLLLQGLSVGHFLSFGCFFTPGHLVDTWCLQLWLLDEAACLSQGWLVSRTGTQMTTNKTVYINERGGHFVDIPKQKGKYTRIRGIKPQSGTQVAPMVYSGFCHLPVRVLF